MENRLTYYTELINKHLSGESSPEEAGILITWINTNQENATLYEEYRKTWNLIEKERIEKQIDVDGEWELLESLLIEGHKVTKSQSHKVVSFYFLRIAAVLLIVAIPTFFLIRFLSQPSMNQLIAENKVLETNLPDGTTVTLNKGSSLEYPSRFKGEIRYVKLKGEGFFQVKHDDKKPFIISSGNIRIEVMGTTFYMNTFAENGFADVILSTGSVAVYYDNNPSEKVLLQPGDKAKILVDGHEIEKSHNEDPNYLAWKTGTLVFNGDPLSKIVPLINKVYHVDVRLKGKNIECCQITATFNGQSLGSVLNVLKATLDLQIKYTGATIELSGNGCK